MTKRYITALLSTAALCVGYDGAGWKTDADGKIEVDGDGNPIMIGSDGKEMTVRSTTVLELQNENRQAREARSAAETKLAEYKDIDPDKARKAMETVSKLDSKALIDAGEVDKVRETIKTEYEAKLAEKDGALNEASNRINQMTINHAFATSEFITDNINIPADMFQASVRDRFKVEDGKIVAYEANGTTPMSSKKHVGEAPSFDEALSLIVESRSDKDRILKAPDAGGTGGNSGGGNRGRSRVLRRSEFDTSTPAQQAQYAAAQAKGELTITD